MHKKRIRSSFGHCGKGVFEVFGFLDLVVLQRQVERRGLYHLLSIGGSTTWIHEHGHARCLGDCFLEELQIFSRYFHTSCSRQSRDVATWSGEAIDHPPPNWVYNPHHDDGNCAGGLLDSTDCATRMSNEEIRPKTQKFGCNAGARPSRPSAYR